MSPEPAKPSEHLFELMIESAPIAMILFNNEEDIIFANYHAEDLFGYNTGELAGNKVGMLVPVTLTKDNEDSRKQLLHSLHTNMLSRSMKFTALKKDRTEFPVEIGLIPISTSDGFRGLATIIDSTEGRMTTEGLKISEHRLQELFDSSPVALSVFDLTSRTFEMNNARALKLFKLSDAELQKRGPVDVSPKFQLDGRLSEEKAKEVLKELIKRQKLECEWTFCDSTNKEITCDLRMILLSDVKAPQILGCFVDITERKIAEQLHSLFSLIVNTSEDAIISKTLDGLITSWNYGAEKIFGYSSEEIIGKHISLITPAYLKSEEKIILHKVVDGRSLEHYETVRRKKDGVNVPVSITISPIRDVQGHIIGASKVLRDITERQKAGEKLQASEIRYRRLFEAARDGVIILKAETGEIEDVNPFLIGILGYAREEFIGKELWEIGLFKDIFANKETFLKLQKEGHIRYEDLPLKTKQGVPIWVEFVSNAYVSDGKLIMQCNIRDITERKKGEDELKELNEHLEERVLERVADLTEANKALEAFSSTVSHDLRAPARAIKSFADIIVQDYGDRMSPKEKELFGYIEESGKRMNTIIDDLLKLAKYGNEKLKLETIDMERLVKGIWLNISRTTKHNASLELKQLPIVWADMSMIQQVVVNLLSNAIKYSSKIVNPVVGVSCEQSSEMATFYFRDNGAGFDMKNYDRLFGAFQRLHTTREFEGTGVGLSLVKRIIEKHGGTVGAEAKVGEGATFYFTLPLV